MDTSWVYRAISRVYDLLDLVYFSSYETSPRKAVVERINDCDRVLDMCTGTAANAIAVAKRRPGANITGIDLSANMLKVAREKVEREELNNVSLYQMEAAQLRFESDSFDKVIISLVLHELDEELAAKLISEAKRVLRHSGEIIVTEWEPSKLFIKRLLFAPIHFIEPRTYRNLLKTELSSYFAKQGLSLREYIHCDYTKVLVLSKL